jgi:hypothetical protein
MVVTVEYPALSALNSYSYDEPQSSGELFLRFAT